MNTRIETATSTVVLDGEFAYKTKKPRNFGYADFRGLDQRRSACERELALNRRLSPDIYLAVEPVTRGTGRVIDYRLKMRRLPARCSLAARLKTGTDLHDDLRAVARRLADFHSRARTDQIVEREGTAAALRKRWHDLFERLSASGLEPADAALLVDISEKADRYLNGRGRLFEWRIQHGFIRDGHGDLLASDIYLLPDGSRLLDCLDFADHLRYVDVIDDAACLAMDLEHLGHCELADYFLGCYEEFSGASSPESLKNHYTAYRAAVRALVSALAAQQGIQHAHAAVHPLLAQAERRLNMGSIRMVMVGGPPGSGKSTLAQALGDELGYAVISSDLVRRETPPSGTPRYSAAEKHRVYQLMLDRADLILSGGQSVVLDATWSQDLERRAAARVAERTESELFAFRCCVSTDLAAARVEKRLSTSDDASEADELVAIDLATRFEPWVDAVPIDGEDIQQKGIARALATVQGTS